MNGLTQDVIDILTRPFALDEHELRDGGRGEKLVYITEEPLTARLTEADPNWQFEIVSMDRTDYGGVKPDFVVVHAALTICGVTRHNTGYNSANVKTREWDRAQGKMVDLAEPVVLPLSQTEVQGAPTDALKRCARLFGVGAYLLLLKGVKIKGEADFANWYRQQFNAPAKSARRMDTAPHTPPKYVPSDFAPPPSEVSELDAPNFAADAEPFTSQKCEQMALYMATHDMADHKVHAANRIKKAINVEALNEHVQGGDSPETWQDLAWTEIYTEKLPTMHVWEMVSAYINAKHAETE